MHPAALAKKRAEIRKETVENAKKVGEHHGIEVSENTFNPHGSGEIKALRTEEAIKDFLSNVARSLDSGKERKSGSQKGKAKSDGKSKAETEE